MRSITNRSSWRQSFDVNLWTDDRRLLRSVSNRVPFVRWIGDYSR